MCSSRRVLLIGGILRSTSFVVFIYAEGLAWDWINEKLYWTDSVHLNIEVFDPATGYRKVLFTLGSSSTTFPSDIVLDPNNG